MHNNDDYLLIRRKMPHIANALYVLWGYPEFNKYILDIMRDTREGTREGFPEEIARALFRLSMLHDDKHPQKDTDIWGLK